MIACCLGVHLWFFVAAQPYPIAAYNPLVGGGDTARQLMTVGWGEGLDQAIVFLNRRSRSDRLVVASNYPHVVRAGFRGTTHSLTRLPSQVRRVDYVVLYLSTAQRGGLSSWAEHVISAGPPVFAARVHGTNYAWVFRVPAALEDPHSVSPTDDDDSDDSEVDEP